MTDKDSQLDEIERLASMASNSVGAQADFKNIIDWVLFQPGGLYYEMRRHNKRMDETLLSYEARITNAMQENEQLRNALSHFSNKELTG